MAFDVPVSQTTLAKAIAPRRPDCHNMLTWAPLRAAARWNRRDLDQQHACHALQDTSHRHADRRPAARRRARQRGRLRRGHDRRHAGHALQGRARHARSARVGVRRHVQAPGRDGVRAPGPGAHARCRMPRPRLWRLASAPACCWLFLAERCLTLGAVPCCVLCCFGSAFSAHVHAAICCGLPCRVGGGGARVSRCGTDRRL